MIAQFIDIHNHTLPNIDDGAKSLDMALDMLKKSWDLGTSEIALTPHHLNGAFYNSSSQIVAKFQELENARIRSNIPLKLHYASEIHLVPEAVGQIVGLQALSYNNHGMYVLIEPPKRGLPIGYEGVFGQLLTLGFTPIIAHPERNSEFAQNPQYLERLIRMGCKTQLTAQSVTGDFGESLQRFALNLLDLGLVHFIASDAHRLNGRSPDLNLSYRFICGRYGQENADNLFYNNPQIVVLGQSALNIRACLPITSKKQSFLSQWILKLKK